jgi:hypothetical protein
LEPGDERVLNFEIPAPIVVPLRVVGTDASPVADVTVCRLEPDADGRLTIYGLPPKTPHVITVNRLTSPFGTVVLGQTAPLSGEPGESLPETEVVCDRAFGEIVGRFVLPVGVAEMPECLGAHVYYPDIGEILQQAKVAPDGTFRVAHVAAGRCSVLLQAVTVPDEFKYWAFIEGVEVQAGGRTDVGRIAPNPPELDPTEQ